MCKYNWQLLETYVKDWFKMFLEYKGELRKYRKAIPIKMYKKSIKKFSSLTVDREHNLHFYHECLFKLGFILEFWKNFFDDNCDKVYKLYDELRSHEINIY